MTDPRIRACRLGRTSVRTAIRIARMSGCFFLTRSGAGAWVLLRNLLPGNRSIVPDRGRIRPIPNPLGFRTFGPAGEHSVSGALPDRLVNSSSAVGRCEAGRGQPVVRLPTPAGSRRPGTAMGPTPGGAGPIDSANGASDQARIFVTRPEPTVRPPSRIAKPSPSSMAIGWISSTVISVLSPGMTISVPSGSWMTPVTSVVRM